ncbi:plasmid transfer ATPase TraJ [Escherichia coli]|uniref:plasmid transfer ATPase TraJ n=1 Tax=Escherichia coli TaxID=562 RepID=UPI003F666B81
MDTLLPLDQFSFAGGVTPDRLRDFLVHCYRHGVSDIHLQSGGPLIVGHHGRMIRCSPFTLDHPTLLYLTDRIFSPDIKALIQRGTGADRSLQLEGNSDGRFGLQRGERLRFRANFTQATIRGLSTAAAVTLRIINNHIPDLSDMGLPEDLFRALAALPHEGIGLICGPTGSGKSTLLTATYQHHGRTSPHCKIVTYEDPVEALLGGNDWVLQPQQCEVGKDVPSFAAGLRLSMRQAPTIIGIGEIRDGETVEGMVNCALSGHLCLGTEHAFSPGHAFSRSVRMLPSDNREPLAWDMLELLQFIIVQRLIPTTDGRRQAVREYILFDESVRSQLRQHAWNQWPSVLNDMLTRNGARIADDAWSLYQEGRITEATATEYIGFQEFTRRKKHG